MAQLRWTLSLMRPYRSGLFVLGTLALLEIALSMTAPWPLKIVVDNVLAARPLPAPIAGVVDSVIGSSAFALLLVVVVTGLLLQVASEIVSMIQTQIQIGIAQRMVYDLRSRLLAHLQDLPLRHHIQARTADSVYRIDSDAYCPSDLALGGVFPLAVAVLKLVVMFVILVRLDATLALLSLSVAPFLYACLRYYSRRMTDRAEQVKARESGLIERAYEILVSVRAVKSFARERQELAKFAKAGDETMKARLRLTWQESLFSVAVTAITLTGTALVLIVGGTHVMDGRLTVGSLLVVIAYLAAVYNPLSSIAETIGSLQQALVSARRVRDIFALSPEKHDAPGALDASTVSGLVRFDHVSFSYDEDHCVLRDVTFDARPGEMVAVVGLTGAGKTTLVSLVPRFFEPTSGRVLIDGIDASRYALRSLRERIAVVPQEPVLFSGSIADNIRYGRLDASDEEIVAAARAAHVHEFAQRLPHGYETQVAEAGATLSGGERQRLGIARAILKNAPILILDEPTSSLDAISEQIVFDALRRLRHERTTIVIAHRLSTIRDATRILVLDDGRLVAQGTHEDLLVSHELYQRMCARLSIGGSLDEPEPAKGVALDIPLVRA
ncbi:MAG: ABC transporter ATP-binding protein [Vicinamibacterales bacterium]